MSLGFLWESRDDNQDKNQNINVAKKQNQEKENIRIKKQSTMCIH